MASFKPEEKYSLIPLICQICDISSDLKWMCPECDLYFCADCELKFHRKNQTLSGHAKIDIEQCSTENINEIIGKAEIEKISCGLHTEEKCNLFCKDCQNTVCKNCVSSGSHQNHELASLEDIFKEKSMEKHNFQTRIESHIDHYTQTANEMEYMLEKATAKYKRTQENILQTEKQLITETKGYFKTMVEKIETEWENIEEMVKEEIKEAESKKGQLVKYDESLTQAIAPLKMLTTSYPLNLCYHVNESVYHHKLQQTSLERYQRHTRWTLSTAIEHEYDLLKGPDFKEVTSFITNFKGISKLILMDNRKAIIASYKDEILQSIQFEKSEIKVKQEISKTKVFDMDIMPNGDILLSVEECELKLLKENEIAEHAPFHSFSPLKTFGVHINKENEIIVGISAGFPTEKDEVSKPGKIVVLNSKGSIKRKHEFEQDEYRNQLCVCPTRIVTNSENKICFIDIFKKAYYGDGYGKNINNKGRIVGIDQEGNVKWIYHGTGHQQSSSSYFLCPKDIAIINSTGCILIYDAPIKHFQTFHILSQDGSAIAYSDLRLTNLDLKLDGLESLAIDKDQKLYVGSDETYRSAKIHIFEFM